MVAFRTDLARSGGSDMGGGGLHLLILAFLAVGWVVNQLLTKEERPPAPRPGPGGPRPPARPTGREPVLRWQGAGEPPKSSQPPPRREDVLVIRNEPTRSSRPLSAPPAPPPQRRPQRRSAPVAAPRRPEPERPRTFAGDVAASVAEAMERPSALTPLNLAQTPQSVANAIRTPVVQGESPTFTAPILTAAFRDRNRLREAYLIYEVLGPPKALRPRNPT